MSFPRYPKYKASGVEWLGHVPEGWEVKRLKHNARLLTQKTDRRDHPVGLENIEGWSGRFLPTETAFEGEGIAFDAGDILFGKLRPYLAKAYLAKASGEAVGDFHVIRPGVGMEGRFVQYQILNREFIAIVDGSTFGSKMPRASWEFVGGMKVTRPPLPEQTAIAEFLDRETGKIDELVAEQRRLIELLREKRQAVISHAVTKGLNPHAPMKPSGIEWLGEVPEHWGVWKLTHAFEKIGSGTTPKTDNRGYYDDGTHPWVNTGDLNDGDLTDCEKKITDLALSDHTTLRIYPAGSVVIAMYGATIGKLAILKFPASVNQACCVFSGKLTIEYKFLFFWLLAYRPQIISLASGGGQPNVNQDILRGLRVACPALAEQITIIKFLEAETAKFDTLTAEAQRAIDLLQERRTALISAAVTGQIDVRHQPRT